MSPRVFNRILLRRELSNRGGGNQFGIVVEFVLKAFPAAQTITLGSLAYPETDIENVLSVVQVSD